MKKLYIGLIAAVCAVLPFSLLLVSSEKEVALMMSKDNMVAAASRIYSKRLKEGDRSAHNLRDMFPLLLKSGKAEDALESWQEFMSKQAPDAQSELILAELYRQLMRLDDYANALEKSVEILPSAEVLHILSLYYDKAALPEKEKIALKRLCEMKEAQPEDILRLSKLQAGDGEDDAAFSSLRHLKERFPAAFSENELYLMTAIALQSNAERKTRLLKEVLSFAKEVLPSDSRDKELLSFAWFLYENNEPLLGLEILEPLQKSSDGKVQECVLALRLAAGQKDKAYEELKSRLMAGSLALRFYPPLTELALERGDEVTLKKVLERKGLSTEEKRAFAFAILDRLKNKAWATALFWDLARNADAESPDVKELLFLWGESPPAEGLEWLKLRAGKTGSSEQLKWLRHLLAAGEAGAVISIVDQAKELPALQPEMKDLYFDALLRNHDLKKLAGALETLAASENNPKRLKEYVMRAEEGGLSSVGLKVLRQLVAVAPGDAWAHGKQGVFAFEEKAYEEASNAFRRYFEMKQKGDSLENRDEYLANFDYGELLMRKGQKAEARKYFEKALTEIQGAANAVERQRIVEAQALLGLERKEEAIAVLQRLIAEGKGGKGARAMLANLLIDEKRYDAARSVLYYDGEK